MYDDVWGRVISGPNESCIVQTSDCSDDRVFCPMDGAEDCKNDCSTCTGYTRDPEDMSGPNDSCLALETTAVTVSGVTIQ